MSNPANNISTMALSQEPITATRRLHLIDNFRDTEIPLPIGDFEADQSLIDSMVSTCRFSLTKIEGWEISSDLLHALREGSLARIETTTVKYVAGVEIEDVFTEFLGFIETIIETISQFNITCADPLISLSETEYDYGSFLPDTRKIQSLPDDPTQGVADHDGVTLVPVTENGEQRWIIPNSVETIPIVLYPEAYSGATSDEIYSGNYNYGAGNFDFTAGSNRRTFIALGLLYDTGMDITTSDPDIEYPTPIPNVFWRIGSDTPNYIEFVGYTPVGLVYLEWAICSVEGTNDIEQIFARLVNPSISGSVKDTAAVSATVLMADVNLDFIAKSIIPGGTAHNRTTGNSADIVEVNRDWIRTSAITGNWNAGDKYELVDSVSRTPRWKEGIHFDSVGGYGTRTIWPSLLTLPGFDWNIENGSALDCMARLLREAAAPNYRLLFDHPFKMVRLQYHEITPHSVAAPWYPNAYGRFITPDAPPGNNDFIEIRVDKSWTNARDSQRFASSQIVQGIYEHPDNLLVTSDQIVTQPPGGAETGWNHSAGVFPGNWSHVKEMGDHTHAVYPGYRDNIKDGVIDTILAWEGTNGLSHSDELSPFLAFDLKALTEIGKVVAYPIPSLRPEFPFTCRFEACQENGIILDGGQLKINPDADWTLMAAGLSYFQLYSGQVLDFEGPWFYNYCRYIRVSMAWAKTNSEKWVKVGFADIQLFPKFKVQGQARIADLTNYVSGLTTGGASGTILQDSTQSFVDMNVEIGDSITHVASATTVLVTAVNSNTEIVTATIAPASWGAGAAFRITKAIGRWGIYPARRFDDGVALLHMPDTNQWLLNQDFATYGKTGDEWTPNHRSNTVIDNSLGSSMNCVAKAQLVLVELLRSQKLGTVVFEPCPRIRVGMTIKFTNPWTSEIIKARVISSKHRQITSELTIIGIRDTTPVGEPIYAIG